MHDTRPHNTRSDTETENDNQTLTLEALKTHIHTLVGGGGGHCIHELRVIPHVIQDLIRKAHLKVHAPFLHPSKHTNLPIPLIRTPTPHPHRLPPTEIIPIINIEPRRTTRDQGIPACDATLRNEP